MSKEILIYSIICWAIGLIALIKGRKAYSHDEMVIAILLTISAPFVPIIGISLFLMALPMWSIEKLAEFLSLQE